MCLTVTNYKENSIAEQDTVVYKVLVSRAHLEKRLARCKEDLSYFSNVCENPKEYEYFTELLANLECALATTSQWFTPYYLAPITIGETVESEVIVQTHDDVSIHLDPYINVAIHSFTSFESARTLCVNDYTENGIIVACIIPKGSIMHVGNFLSDHDSAASSKLTYVKQVKKAIFYTQELNVE